MWSMIYVNIGSTLSSSQTGPQISQFIDNRIRDLKMNEINVFTTLKCRQNGLK